MYEIDYKWQVYYDERNPHKRKALLAELSGGEEELPANDLRRKLFDRHYKDLDRQQPIDLYFRHMFDLLDLGRHAPFLPSTAMKRIRRDLDGFGFDLIADYGDEGRTLLYHELRNGVTRYLWTCTSDDYGRVLDMIKLPLQQKKNRMSGDLNAMTHDVVSRYKTQQKPQIADDMDLFVRAAEDAWAEFDAKYQKTSEDD